MSLRPLFLFIFSSRLRQVLLHLKNNEDPYQMPHKAAFPGGISWGSTLFGKTKRIFTEKMMFSLEILTCDTSIYTMNHPKYVASNQKEDSISK